VILKKHVKQLRKEKLPKKVAKILHRDIKNVNNDMSKLSELGFITLKKSKSLYIVN